MAGEWNHNIQYHGLVLRSVPSSCSRCLDVGSGQGLLTRKLAGLCEEVIGIDLVSTGNDPAPPKVCFVAGDAMTYPFAAGGFDCIAAVATLHHLPLRNALERFGFLLKPGGVLVVIGLYRPVSLLDHAWAFVALPASWVLRLLRGNANVGAPLCRPEQTLAEIRDAARDLLPGAEVRRLLFFRYSLIWRK
jgi:SAM-dependent methyltransferase